MTKKEIPTGLTELYRDYSQSTNDTRTVDQDLKLFGDDPLPPEYYPVLYKLNNTEWWERVVHSGDRRGEIMEDLSVSELSADSLRYLIPPEIQVVISLDAKNPMRIQTEIPTVHPIWSWLGAHTIRWIEDFGVCPRFRNSKRVFEIEPTTLTNRLNDDPLDDSFPREDAEKHLSNITGMSRSWVAQTLDYMLDEHHLIECDDGNLRFSVSLMKDSLDNRVRPTIS